MTADCWNDYITNKLACLCPDAMELPHIRIVAATLAAFGIHLISPFFATTKGKSMHAELQSYFSEVHHSLLNDDIDDSFFEFNGGFFKGISSYLVDNIKKTEYGIDVIMAITETAIVYKDDAIKLANKICVKMADVLTQQRGGYYGFGQKDQEYYVFDQAPNIDQTTTNNLEQERQCGDADHHLKKKPSISTVSRGVILKSTVALHNANPNPSDFRKMGSIVKVLEQMNNEWSAKQQSLLIAGLSKNKHLSYTLINGNLPYFPV